MRLARVVAIWNRVQTMEAVLSIEDLARRTEQSVEQLRQWHACGLLGGTEQDQFASQDVERVRLIRLFLRKGIDLPTIVDWVRRGEMERHLAMLGTRAGGPTYSVAEAAQRLHLEVGLLRRVLEVIGLAEGPLADEDLEALRMCKTGLDIGFPAEAMVQFVRVFADAMRRVAETEAHLFYFYIRRTLQERGLPPAELTRAVALASDGVETIAEPALLYFHRMALRHAIEDTAIMELAEQAGILGPPELPGQLRAVIVFVDMTGFTALTEAMGDLKTAEVLDRFSALVRQAVGRWDGHVVKQIGDAFMLTFDDPADAVHCALEIERRTAAEPQFPSVRSGIHCGPVLYRDGDYVGANVNLASRVAAESERHQVLVTGAVRREVTALSDVEFVRLPKRRLKGLTEEIDLFEARASAGDRATRVVDPVCRMELGPGEVAARLALDGTERAFCSEECLRRFVATPERYATT